MNKVAFGDRIELIARKKLEGMGYLVERKNKSRFRSPDFWGMFDLIAIKGSEVRLIQIKSNSTDFYKARADITTWKQENKVELSCEVWLHITGSEFRIEVML